jgi:hypothetical protein
MNITLDQIRALNSQEAEQMRRYIRNVLLKRIKNRNRQARDLYEREQDEHSSNQTITGR